MKIVKQWRNARAVVKQLNNNEWKFTVYGGVNDPLGASSKQKVYSADRGRNNLWVANGAWCCDVNEANSFGLILRHYVWHAAAGRKKKEALKKEKANMPFIDLTD